MCKADLLAVAQLEKECFAEAWSENALAESLAEANYVFFVAVVSKPSCMADEKDTEEIAGYVGAYLAADELSITNVAVFSSYRQCGAANQLMKALDAFAQEKNLYGITLEVRVSNNAAIALYEIWYSQRILQQTKGRCLNYVEILPVVTGISIVILPEIY